MIEELAKEKKGHLISVVMFLFLSLGLFFAGQNNPTVMLLIMPFIILFSVYRFKQALSFFKKMGEEDATTTNAV